MTDLPLEEVLISISFLLLVWLSLLLETWCFVYHLELFFDGDGRRLAKQVIDPSKQLLKVTLRGMSSVGLVPVKEVLELDDIAPIDVVYKLYDLGVDGLIQEGYRRRLRVVA
mmetsp:Transcript_37900/g.36317  ORF Transcript_37900/g.36317 Transcript_37900/m.36317 type:complete len:112 (-) Transcript_37900:243-578(-)